MGRFPLSGAATSLFVEDLGFARKNLLLGRLDSTGTSERGSPGTLEAVDPNTGDWVWRSPVLWGAPQRNSLVFFAGRSDGTREAAFATGQSIYLTR